MKQGKKGGLRLLTGRMQEVGGGGHSDAYCVQQGGKNAYVINGKPLPYSISSPMLTNDHLSTHLAIP